MALYINGTQQTMMPSSYTASRTSFNNTGTGMASTNVQNALTELNTDFTTLNTNLTTLNTNFQKLLGDLTNHPYVADLNNATDIGNYYAIPGTLNSPSSNYWLVTVQKQGSGGWIMQTATSVNLPQPETYFRTYNSGWTAWQKYVLGSINYWENISSTLTLSNKIYPDTAYTWYYKNTSIRMAYLFFAYHFFEGLSNGEVIASNLIIPVSSALRFNVQNISSEGTDYRAGGVYIDSDGGLKCVDYIDAFRVYSGYITYPY